MSRTDEQIRTDAIVGERTGILTMVAKHRAGVEVQVRNGKISEAEADLVNRNIASFAESCVIGLHIEAETPAAVREAMRPLMKGLTRG